MNIAFIHRGGEQMASYRYRTKIPSEQLSDEYTTSINAGTADIVVFSKPMEPDLELAKICKKDGTKVVVDYCDDHFKHPTQGQLYKEMASLSDMVVCNTDKMKEIIYQETGKDAYQISDPFEQPRSPPHAEGENYLWFGHQLNINEIVPWIGKLDLSVCTGPNDILTGYIPWSPENLREELLYANIVFLPKSQDYKSPNRLINAMMAGCFVISPYKEFRDFTWSGNPYTGFKWIRAFKEDLNELVSKGQDYIEENYSPKVIGDQWKTIIRAL